MGLSIWHLLVVLAIALVIFGSRKLRNLGGDLGGAIRNFKSAVTENEDTDNDEVVEEEPRNKKVTKLEKKAAPRVIEGKATTTRSRKKKA